jgi:hypothetical protein
LKRELPFESARVPKKSNKGAEVYDSDPEESFVRKTKTTTSSTTVKKSIPAKKSDARIKLERECYTELTGYRCGLMRRYDVDSKSIASDQCLWDLCADMPIKAREIADNIKKCGAHVMETTLQGFVDIMMKFRSRGRELSDREVVGRRSSAEGATSAHFHHTVKTVRTSEKDGRRVVEKESKSITRGGNIPVMKMKR